MMEFSYTIQDEKGLHARPAGIMVREANRFTSKLTISKDGKSADLKKLFAVLELAVKQGETVYVTAQGADEDAAAAVLEAFLQENF